MEYHTCFIKEDAQITSIPVNGYLIFGAKDKTKKFRMEFDLFEFE